MATRTWLGNAQDIKQVNTVTIAGAWTGNPTITLTINGIEMVVAIGSLVTTAQVATTLKEAWESASTFTDSTATVSPAGGGTVVPEFADITATVSGSVVSFTADTAGRPFVLTSAETAGSGTALSATPTPATGKHFWDNVDNWSAVTVPVNGDTVVFDSGDVDLLYELTPSTTVHPAAVIITNGYEGRIGNGEVNKDNADPDFWYTEYRDKYLTFTFSSGTMTIDIGGEEGAGSGRTRIDAGAIQTTMDVKDSGTRVETGEPAITFLGTSTSNEFNVSKGDLGIAFYEGELSSLTTLRVGFTENEFGDAEVVCGSGTTFSTDTITVTGGKLTISSNNATIEQTGGELIVLGGTHTTINCDGGNLSYRSNGTVTTLRVSDGHFDKSADMRATTITTVQLYKGAKLSDPHGVLTMTNGYKINRARAAEVTVDVGVDKTYAIS